MQTNKSLTDFVNEASEAGKGEKKGDFDNIEAPSIDPGLRGYGDVVVLNSKNEMLLLKRHSKDDNEAGKWGLPGGKLEINEDNEDGAYREMFEEAGDVVKKSDMRFIGDYTNTNGSVSYVYTGPYTSNKPVLSDEHDEFAWFSVDNLPEIAFDGEDRIIELFEAATTK